MANDFTEALEDIIGNVPQWWATATPSTLAGILGSIADSIDDVAMSFQQIYDDQSLASASEYGLLNNFAFAWGLQSEQLPSVLESLRAYIEARTSEDGSLRSLELTLSSLVETPQNTTGGEVLTFPAEGELTFPANGEGLHFPANGEGLTFGALIFPFNGTGLQLYEFGPGEGPSLGLVFPANGEGLHFPTAPETITAEDTIIADTGQTPPGVQVGLRFAENGFVEIRQNTPGAYETEVRVANWLAYNRAAFRRAVERFQQAHCLPTVIREVIFV